MDRRHFVSLTATAAVAHVAGARAWSADAPSRFKAIVFDGLAVFDPRPVSALTESLFPGRGAAITDAWRTRQFDYQWLSALAGRYVDFLQATDASLRFVVDQMRLEASDAVVQRLVAAYAQLNVWPDVPDALPRLRAAGLRLALLSNMTPRMLTDGLQRAGITSLFDQAISTDVIKSFKPDPRTYALAEERLRLRREEILFVPFAGWDVAGAKWFGYPTYWTNRLRAPRETLGIAADAEGTDVNDLARYVTT